MAEVWIVKGSCTCGQRFRVRNPPLGFEFPCPACDTPIRITKELLAGAELDVSSSQKPTRSAPKPAAGDVPDPYRVSGAPAPDAAKRERRRSAEFRLAEERVVERETLREAKLVEESPLRLAPRGGEVGATGRIEYTSGEAQLAGAMGLPTREYRRSESSDGASAAALTDEESRPARSFLADIVASFYLAGVPANYTRFLSMIAAMGLIVLFLIALPIVLFGPLGLYVVSPFGRAILFIYVFQFTWWVIGATANHDDQIMLGTPNFDFWDQVFWPVVQLLVISLLCAVPALLVGFNPDVFGGEPRAAFLLALLVGYFFWPMCVMCVAIGETIQALRPDWILRGIFAVGPVYLLAYAAVATALVVHVLADELISRSDEGLKSALPGTRLSIVLITSLVNLAYYTLLLYSGYVVARTLGVLYRHHATRFPWNR